MNYINPMNQVHTVGVRNELKLQDHLSDLWVAVIEQYKKEPDICLDGELSSA